MNKQAIKEFLKPTKWNIILLILIFFGGILSVSFPMAGGCEFFIGQCFLYFLGWPILMVVESFADWRGWFFSFILPLTFSICYLYFLLCLVRFLCKKVKQFWWAKLGKFIIGFLLLASIGFLLFSIYTDTQNKKLYCGSPTGNSRIKSVIGQSRTVMRVIYNKEKNYDRFTCLHEYMKFLCEKIIKNYQRYQNRDDRKMAISHDALVNSQSVCIYSPLSFPGYWYCADSTGVAGETKIDPGTDGFCIDGVSAKCPPIAGD